MTLYGKNIACMTYRRFSLMSQNWTVLRIVAARIALSDEGLEEWTETLQVMIDIFGVISETVRYIAGANVSKRINICLRSPARGNDCPGLVASSHVATEKAEKPGDEAMGSAQHNSIL